MCGRFALTASPQEVAELLELEMLEAFPPRYNIAPTQPILMANIDAANKRVGTLVRWGLVPTWVKDPKGIQPPDQCQIRNRSIKTIVQKCHAPSPHIGSLIRLLRVEAGRGQKTSLLDNAN